MLPGLGRWVFAEGSVVILSFCPSSAPLWVSLPAKTSCREEDSSFQDGDSVQDRQAPEIAHPLPIAPNPDSILASHKASAFPLQVVMAGDRVGLPTSLPHNRSPWILVLGRREAI